jgi:hypothetical protein
MTIPATSFGPQIVADTARALVIANWSSVATTDYLKAMGAPGLPAPVIGNVYTSRRALFTAETQPAIGLSVARTSSSITDALGAMDQVHELEIVLCSDWGWYDAMGNALPLVQADPLDPAIPFTAEVYETALRCYVETIVLILTSPTFGFPNFDARNRFVPGATFTGIYNALPFSGISPQDFVVGEDETGQTVIQQTVRASIQVLQRRSLAL